MDGNGGAQENDAPGVAGSQLGRRYSGMEPSERAMERHHRFVQAGLEIFGTVGYQGATIKSLCQGAGLSERYFYESFATREHLLGAVYEQLNTQLARQINNAMTAPGLELLGSLRAGLAAVVNFMLEDPRHAHIMLVEIVGVSPALETKRHQAMQDFAAESKRMLLLLGGIDPEEARVLRAAGELPECLASALDAARLLSISMVGGVNNLLLDAVLSGTTWNRDGITEVSFQLICNASTGIRALAQRA